MPAEIIDPADIWMSNRQVDALFFRHRTIKIGDAFQSGDDVDPPERSPPRARLDFRNPQQGLKDRNDIVKIECCAIDRIGHAIAGAMRPIESSRKSETADNGRKGLPNPLAANMNLPVLT